MKSLSKIVIVLGLSVLVTSCSDTSRPNYQYFPNMYQSVGYETYAESDAFANGKEGQEVPDGAVKRGFVPYEYPNTTEGYTLARANLMSPLDSVSKNSVKGSELFLIYCAVCHGEKGDGQGILMKREKILGVPSYAVRDISEGSTFHVLTYGLNSMGSYANQLSQEERWMVASYVMKLKSEL
jgi:cytochrome c553